MNVGSDGLYRFRAPAGIVELRISTPAYVSFNQRYEVHPGRNEIDETQELYYPAITKAVMATGYDGYYAHEFVPKKKDKLQSLREAVKICDV